MAAIKTDDQFLPTELSNCSLSFYMVLDRGREWLKKVGASPFQPEEVEGSDMATVSSREVEVVGLCGSVND